MSKNECFQFRNESTQNNKRLDERPLRDILSTEQFAKNVSRCHVLCSSRINVSFMQLGVTLVSCFQYLYVVMYPDTK